MVKPKYLGRISELHKSSVQIGYISTFSFREQGKEREMSERRIWSQRIDNHYILMEGQHVNDFGHPFGVVDDNKPEEVDRRLYQRALEFVCSVDELIDKTKHAGTSKAIDPRTQTAPAADSARASPLSS